MAPPPPPAAQPGASASLPAETRRSPGVWRGARLPAPSPTLSRSGSAASLSPPSGGGNRAAPTGICDAAIRAPEDHKLARTVSWGHRRGESERSKGEKRRPTDSAAPPRSGCGAGCAGLHLGKLWLPCWLPGRGRGTRSPGLATSVRPAWYAEALGASISRAPCHYRDLASTEGHRGAGHYPETLSRLPGRASRSPLCRLSQSPPVIGSGFAAAGAWTPLACWFHLLLGLAVRGKS